MDEFGEKRKTQKTVFYRAKEGRARRFSCMDMFKTDIHG